MAETGTLPFPTDPAEFDGDDRISFSRLDNKHIAVLDDGTEYEFDSGLRRWIPTLDDALVEEHQRAYMGSAAAADEAGGDAGPRRKKRKREPPQQQQRPNTAVYVTGLPADATAGEVHDLFARKCGVVAEEIDSGQPRIKMYADAAGRFKGDALVVFFKPQSVDMAIMLLDDTDFRLAPAGSAGGGGRMRVQAADSSYKKTNYDEAAAAAAADRGGGGGGSGGGGGRATGSGSGNGNADGGQGKPAGRSSHDKKKIIRKTQKLDAKLADWDDDEPQYLPTSRGKWDKVVILVHMFTLEELEEDAAAILEIKEDIREECEKLGPVSNVVLFDLEKDGIVMVKFKNVESAEACIAKMDGRSFDGRTVEAYLATGKERFRKSSKEGDDGGDQDED